MSDLPAHRRYVTGDYLAKNPTWDQEDSPWKAGLVADLLLAARLEPQSIADVGCGAGAVLRELRTVFPAARLTGFDIAPDASRFWPRHAAANIDFRLGDFWEASAGERYDVILLLDVVEHLPDPAGFLTRIRDKASYFVFHFPLDLSALTVLREKPLLMVREKVGHLHYYTRGLAQAAVTDAGFQILEWRYTGASFYAAARSWKTRLASIARRLACAVNRDFGARLLGGETLLILARPSQACR